MIKICQAVGYQKKFIDFGMPCSGAIVDRRALSYGMGG
jgi:hypothetical protein